MQNKLFSFLLVVSAGLAAMGAEAPLPLVPAPRSLVRGEGMFSTPLLRLPEVSNEYEPLLAETLAACVRHETKPGLPAEGYELVVDVQGVRTASADDAGRFYAFQTLRQLAATNGNHAVVPCVTISDAPSYRWRGLMIDDARHFLGKETILRQIDLMAYHKLNRFHWHLVDDQGWRLEIKRHPELVQYGAVRPRSVKFGSSATWPEPERKLHYEYNTDRYGPYFYTHEDVKEILAYAKARHVTVVPEIELPGHERALLAARPDLGCRGDQLARVPRVSWSIEQDVLCAGNDDMVKYLEEIFDEVCELFPESPVIHIGGDECPKKNWEKCAKCQARKKALGLADERGLQAWLTRHFADYLGAKGRRIVGWDEVLYGDVPQSVIGMIWRTSARGGAGGDYVSAAQALARGFDLVMTPKDHCYYSYPQRLRDDPYPYYSRARDTDPTVETAYAFDPCAGIPAPLRAHVLGGQASVWGEAIWTRFDFEWKAWPRTAALAETLWTGPARENYYAFIERLKPHRRRLLRDNVNCAPFAEDIVSGGVETLTTTNARVDVARYGARVMRFAAGGDEVIWRPAKWRVQGDRWSHGGIPLCWPWFGSSGPVGSRSHGFAWKTAFEVVSRTETPARSELVLACTSTEKTRKEWPYDFRLELRLVLTDRLHLELRTTNTGREPFPLTCGFHPYFRVADVTQARVTGVDGLASCDSRLTRVCDRIWRGDLPLVTSYDDVFVEPSATARHTLVDAAGKRTIVETSRGAARLVVWTPGEETFAETEPGAGDLAEGDWRHLVCVEPAILWQDAAVTVAPGATHVLETEIALEKKAGK